MLNLILLFSTLAFGAISNSDRALVERGDNLLKNGGFEAGKAQFTASGGAFATSTTAANVGKGSVAGSWDSNGAAQTLTSTAVAIPAGLYGRNGVASCIIQGAGATHTLEAYDGTNILATQTITSQAEYARTSVNFIFPSSGNISLRLVSVAADEPIVYIDDCYLGPADTFNISQVSQASLVGSITWSATANCEWLRTNASYGAQSTDNDCDDNARTVTGIVTDSSAGLRPEFGMTNAPPGEYMVVVSGYLGQSGSGAATSSRAYFQLYNGSAQVGAEVPVNCTGASGTLACSQATAVFQFSYTGGSPSYSIRSKTAGTNPQSDIDVTTVPLQIKVYRFPTSSEIAYRPDVVNRAGQVKNAAAASCRWSTTSGSYGSFSADADCATSTAIGSGSAPGTKIPAGVFTNVPPGKYLVSVSGSFVAEYAATSTGCNYRVYDGTNEISAFDAYATSANTYEFLSGSVGMVSYSSLQSSLTIEIQGKRSGGGGSCSVDNGASGLLISLIPIDQSLPMPSLVGSVTSNSSGQERIERADITCSGSSSVNYQSGSWVSSVGNISAGGCALTIASGILSSAYSCEGTILSHSSATIHRTASITKASPTSMTVYCRESASGSSTIGACASYGIDLICQSSK